MLGEQVSATTGQGRSLTLPRIKRVVLRDFTLFPGARELELSPGDGVFCIAGANELGKSTLIAALNFGLTGRVPDPRERFRSPAEYFSGTKTYSESFFEGRIEEADRESAEVEVEFRLGQSTYAITRGMFEPDQLRRCEMTPPLETNPSSGEERQQAFERRVAIDSGLSGFDQFVFLQLFLMTFDERRLLTFWDQIVLEGLLFLAFGVDPATANAAQESRRHSERLDSRSRNLTWQASEIRKKLRDVSAALAEEEEERDTSIDLREQHVALTKAVDEGQRLVETADAKLQDSQVLLADLSALQRPLRDRYDSLYRQHFRRRRQPRVHPAVAESLREEQCFLCGARDADALASLRARVEADVCPVCESPSEAARVNARWRSFRHSMRS